MGLQNSLSSPYNVSGCGGGDVYVTTPGNIVVNGGVDISFTACTFQHLGAYAAEVRPVRDLKCRAQQIGFNVVPSQTRDRDVH